MPIYLLMVLLKVVPMTLSIMKMKITTNVKTENMPGSVRSSLRRIEKCVVTLPQEPTAGTVRSRKIVLAREGY